MLVMTKSDLLDPWNGDVENFAGNVLPIYCAYLNEGSPFAFFNPQTLGKEEIT